ncbi:hypothetical protein [Pseudohalioglobus lutimaris]|uniref:HlyD family secretion protein n=1 Tax=Pseudohalioglobus lutimaris TaxID=1737061 RepID=A0A2N5WY85_9GAMM|nr:hypothetical protein [Pseudohalioglobus lutimaris]PLW67205.1 hypothetical protein C0039_18195 [Pseudohalioglobus lutimaris]
MKHAQVLTLISLLLGVGVKAQSISLEDLGALQLTYATALAVDSYPGRPMAARVGFRPGEALSLVVPVRVRQTTYQHPPGTEVEKGDRIALLSGPEIHHFNTAFQMLADRLDIAERRFNSNRTLYARKAIDESRWVEISEAYYALQLEFEHMRHFHQLLEPAGEEDSMWLTSPAPGLLDYRQPQPGMAAGTELALIIPIQALRLQVAVPLAQRETVAALAFGDCEVPVAMVSGIAHEYFVEAWSEVLSASCRRLPGERLMVTPVMAATGYSIPRRAIMQWQGETAVLIRQAGSLTPVTVELLTTADDHYIVSSNVSLDGQRVLSTSVSAVQGILMGLGGE